MFFAKLARELLSSHPTICLSQIPFRNYERIERLIWLIAFPSLADLLHQLGKLLMPKIPLHLAQDDLGLSFDLGTSLRGIIHDAGRRKREGEFWAQQATAEALRSSPASQADDLTTGLANLTGRRRAELGPLLHELPPLADHVSAPVSALDLGPNVMSQTDLDGASAVRSLLVGKIGK